MGLLHKYESGQMCKLQRHCLVEDYNHKAINLVDFWFISK